MKDHIKRLVRFAIASAAAVTLLGTAGAVPAAAASVPLPIDFVDCPVSNDLVLVMDYGKPHARVQAHVSVMAPPKPEGFFWVEVVYEDSIGRKAPYTAPFNRPITTMVSLPGDGRGLSNIVKVYARMWGQVAGVDCKIGLVNAGPIPELDTKCHESMLGTGAPPVTIYESLTPQAAAQLSVDYEARGIGVALTVEMTNSIGSTANVAGYGLGPEARTHLAPLDGRGVYNVTKVAIKLEGPVWTDVLQCSPRITTAGALSQRASACFANGPVTISNPDPGFPSEAHLTLESRRSYNGLAGGSATLVDGSVFGFGTRLIPTYQDNGMPETTFRFPETGDGVRDARQFTIWQSVRWHKLLKCKISVTRATGNDWPRPQIDQ